jgi:hypothetical protein
MNLVTIDRTPISTLVRHHIAGDLLQALARWAARLS